MSKSFYFAAAGIVLAAIAVVLLASCTTTQLSKAQAAATEIGAAGANLKAVTAKDSPAILAVTGSNAKVTNALSYTSAIGSDAQTLGPLLSDLIGLIPVKPATTGTN